MFGIDVPARAHFLICYALPHRKVAAVTCSGQSAFPDLLRSCTVTGNPACRFRPERIS